MAASGAVAAGGPAAPRQGLGGWLRGLLRFAADRNDFRRSVLGRRRGRGVGKAREEVPRAARALCLPHRNLLLNVGLFAAGVWVARNLTDIDLMAPQPAA